MTGPIPSPYLAPLLSVVAQIYHRMPTHTPPTLSVCLCPVCMTKAELGSIIATPVRDLPASLLDAYRNSAHGVPPNPDDLRAMLPRYLDLMARDEWSDDLGIGADLQRFGDGRITHAPLFDPATDVLLNDWARLMILHTGTAEATGHDPNYGLTNLIEVLLVGGWPPALLTQTLDDLFAADIGRRAMHAFLRPLGNDSMNTGHFHFWALPRYRPEAIPPVLAWLNHLLGTDHARSVLLAADPLTDPWARALLARAGTLTLDAFASC